MGGQRTELNITFGMKKKSKLSCGMFNFFKTRTKMDGELVRTSGENPLHHKTSYHCTETPHTI